MATECSVDEREVHNAVNAITEQLLNFDDDTKARVLRTIQTLFDLNAFDLNAHVPPRRLPVSITSQAATNARELSFSDREELSPKEFVFQKQPKTDVERVACLAYYLARYRDTRHIKTVDVSKMNTEAAQAKFSNTACAVANAVSAGLLTTAGKGAKQISAMGERFVEALPDRSAAKEIKSSVRTRRTRKRTTRKSK